MHTPRRRRVASPAHRSPARVEPMEGRVLFDASALSLAVTATTLPAAASDESTVKGHVTVTVTNPATVATGKEKVTLSVLVANANGSVTVAHKPLVVSLAADGAKAYTLPVVVKPAGLADGVYAVYGQVVDTAGGTATSPPTAATLTVAPPVVTLAVAQTPVKLPATLASGGKLKGAVDKVAVTNSGTDPLTVPFTVDVVATTDGVAADGSVIGMVTSRAKIPANKTVIVAVKLEAPPADGAYTVFASVDTTTGLSATSAAGPTLTVGTSTTPTPTPTTTPSATVTSATAQYTYDQLEGENDHATEIDTKISFTNPGASASGTYTLTLYASDTAAGATSAATQIGQIPLTLTVGTGTSTISANFGLTKDYSYTGYSGYIIIDIAAPDGTVTEARYATEIRFDGLATDA